MILMNRHAELLKNDGHHLLPSTDPRSIRVARVTSRLITALEEQDNHVVSGASWPPRSQELAKVIAEREAYFGPSGQAELERYKPSGVAKSDFVPFRPQSSNPLKRLESADWNLYVVDLVS